MDERLVSSRLLRATCGGRWSSEEPARTILSIRSNRANGEEESSSGRLVSLHGSVLFALHGGNSRKRRGHYWNKPSWVSLRRDSKARPACRECQREIAGSSRGKNGYETSR